MFEVPWVSARVYAVSVQVLAGFRVWGSRGFPCLRGTAGVGSSGLGG